jgi:toxin-antitoxin system PIN domain toxin
MRALLDINVLVALFDPDHPYHALATDWLHDNVADGWASCPTTQNGCVRMISHVGYRNPLPAAAVIDRLRDAVAHPAHEFWPDDLAIADAALVDASRIHGPRQLTDVYLLALVTRRGGRFVTFDGGIALAAVRGASARNLLVLGAKG